MNRIPVSSSNVASVGYEDASSTLEIEFLGGAVYQYFDVPRAVFDGLLQAQSVGAFIHQQVRGVYRYAKA
jgi:hypothetical protein